MLPALRSCAALAQVYHPLVRAILLYYITTLSCNSKFLCYSAALVLNSTALYHYVALLRYPATLSFYTILQRYTITVPCSGAPTERLVLTDTMVLRQASELFNAAFVSCWY